MRGFNLELARNAVGARGRRDRRGLERASDAGSYGCARASESSVSQAVIVCIRGSRGVAVGRAVVAIRLASGGLVFAGGTVVTRGLCCSRLDSSREAVGAGSRAGGAFRFADSTDSQRKWRWPWPQWQRWTCQQHSLCKSPPRWRTTCLQDTQSMSLTRRPHFCRLRERGGKEGNGGASEYVSGTFYCVEVLNIPRQTVHVSVLAAAALPAAQLGQDWAAMPA